jgi:hypothetical protein
MASAAKIEHIGVAVRALRTLLLVLSDLTVILEPVRREVRRGERLFSVARLALVGRDLPVYLLLAVVTLHTEGHGRLRREPTPDFPHVRDTRMTVRALELKFIIMGLVWKPQVA